MTTNDADRIIAEYMDENYCQCSIYTYCPSPSQHHENCINKECGKRIVKDSWIKYSNSLDRLVPVWEKLYATHAISFHDDYGGTNLYLCTVIASTGSGETFQEAAAIATAKAIEAFWE